MRNYTNEINQICGRANNLGWVLGIFQNARSHLEGGSPEVTHFLRRPVSSDVSCIVIKSDRRSMKAPCSGEIVHVAGQTGSFVVMHVDHGRHVAQLMERTGKHRLFDVPFDSLRTLNRTLANTIHRFLESRDEASERDGRGRNR